MSLFSQDDVIVYFRVGKPQICPRILKSCLKLLDFSKKLFESCLLSKIKMTAFLAFLISLFYQTNLLLQTCRNVLRRISYGAGRPLATSSLVVGRFAANWRRFMANIGSLCSPRGRLVASLLLPESDFLMYNCVMLFVFLQNQSSMAFYTDKSQQRQTEKFNSCL